MQRVGLATRRRGTDDALEWDYALVVVGLVVLSSGRIRISSCSGWFYTSLRIPPVPMLGVGSIVRPCFPRGSTAGIKT